MKKSIFLFAIVTLAVYGCNLVESTLDKQIKACVDDVKLGLGDPESLEIVSAEQVSMDVGWFRIELKFTAKNAMGGRIRGDTVCGFKSKQDTKLNSEDIENQEREFARDLREIGIRR